MHPSVLVVVAMLMLECASNPARPTEVVGPTEPVVAPPSAAPTSSSSVPIGASRVGPCTIPDPRPPVPLDTPAVIAANRWRFAPCCDAALAIEPKGMGLVVELLVDATGAVTCAGISPRTAPPIVLRCIADTAAKIQFAAPGAGGGDLMFPVFCRK